MKNSTLIIILSLSLLTVLSSCGNEDPTYTSANPRVPSLEATKEMRNRYEESLPPDENGDMWDFGGIDAGSNDINNTFNNNTNNNWNSTNNVNQTNGGNNSNPAGESNEGDPSADMVLREADIIHREGNIFYALSKVSGLYTIEIDDASQLAILDHYQLPGRPFEMTIRGTNAYVVTTHTTGSENGNSEAVHTHSKLLDLDLSDPDHIRKEDMMVLTGTVTDTRMVGDFLYLLTTSPSQAGQTHKIYSVRTIPDQPLFEQNQQSINSSVPEDKPVLYTTAQHLYVASTFAGNWSGFEEQEFKDRIYMYDISGTSGALFPRSETISAGPIDYRWQLNEHNGVLRVISQPTFDLPWVETFDATNSLQFMASIQVQVPYGEVLKSVQYDGNRGYLITVLVETRNVGTIDEPEWEENIRDPLYIIDLSEPMAPLQRGSLEMPGFVHFMQVQGSTMVGLSVGDDGDSLSMSLIDVSNMDMPLLVERVDMPGEFDQLAEDFDRIHKALTIDWERGLILMPFSQIAQETPEGYNTLEQFSGVALFGFSANNIDLLSTLPHLGYARRSRLLDDNTVLTMGDLWLGIFDISTPALPTLTSQLPIGHASFHLQRTEDGNFIYLVQTGFGNAPQIHIQAPEHLGSLTPIHAFSLDDIAGDSSNQYSTFLALTPQYLEFKYHEGKAYVAWGINPPITQKACKPSSSSIDPEMCAAPKTGLMVIDFSSETPSLLARHEFDISFPWLNGRNDSSDSSPAPGRLLTIADGKLLFNTEELIKISSIESPEAQVTSLTKYASLAPFSPFDVDSDQLTYTRMKQLSTKEVAFYQDALTDMDSVSSIDFSTQNTPGIVLHKSGDFAVSLDYKYETSWVSPDNCYNDVTNSWFDMDSALCHTITYEVKIMRYSGKGKFTLIDSYETTTPVEEIIVLNRAILLTTGPSEVGKKNLRAINEAFSNYQIHEIILDADHTILKTTPYFTGSSKVKLTKLSGDLYTIIKNSSEIDLYQIQDYNAVRVGTGSMPSIPRTIYLHKGILYTAHGHHGIYSHETTLPQ
ncbi:beta-propeller domain-containing protein [Myxococcota bacterium]|nr:beta-propeller domain-containing protein [Myxococcota bacterium]MBU1496202.1 beta-propeller domain-containing protein [Myxococcota bacterium]